MINSTKDLLMIVVPIVSVVVIFGIIIPEIRSTIRKRKNGGIDPVKEAQFRKYQEEREQRKLAQTIVKTKILDGYSIGTSSGPGLLETAGRATIGGALGGPIGALIGGSTGRRTYREYRQTTFKVWYADGSTKIRTVSHGSYEWEKFIEKLED